MSTIFAEDTGDKSIQEKIREGLISKITSIRAWRTCPNLDLSIEDDADDILKYLDKMGCMIETDEKPFIPQRLVEE